MGKTVGLIGEVNGKVGNVVFYTRNGVQVTRVYVAHPNNPKSSAQNRQRLKMALCGRLSSIVPFAAIEGFGGNKSQRRSRFLQYVLRSATSVDGRAVLLENSLLFSDGATGLLNVHSVRVLSASGNLRGVAVDSRLPSSGYVLPEGYGERFVVLFLNTGTSNYDYAVTGLVNLPTSASTDTATGVSVRVGDPSAAYRAIVYLYPFVLDGSNVNMDFRASYIGTEDGTVVVDQLTGEELSVPLLYGRSLCLGGVDIPAPAQS